MEDYKKRYEEALSQAEKELKCCGSLDCDAARQIFRLFPELKDSEDERIRKALLNEFIHLQSKGYKFAGLEGKEIISWLEKQGEQKPTDKVEPKFKVGDWIINSEGMLRHILAVDKTGYQTDYGWLTHDIYDNTYHLWTIQDAKDGDVLATDSWLYIFKYTNNKAIIQFHCCCPIIGKPPKWCFLSDDSYLDIYIDANIHPAAKEQRDLFFQKMKEAGYEWDADKKELRKIEQNPAWSEEDEIMLNNVVSTLEPLSQTTHSGYAINSMINWIKSLKERIGE